MPTVALDARLVTRQKTGDTNYWRGLVRALARMDGPHDYLLYSNAERPASIPETPRVRWMFLPGRSDRWWSLALWPLAARRAGARVLHTQYFLSPLAGRRGVTTIHDVSFLIGPEWFSAKDRLLLSQTVPGAARRAARVFTVSQTSRQEIERHIPAARGKVVVTPNALGENIRPHSIEGARRRVQALGVPQPYVLTVGTRWPRKNTRLAVDAARQAGVPLVVTGHAWDGEAGQGAFATGYVDDLDLTALYQCGSLYLATAFHEGFGIPLLEAFACGCPVMCSQGGALPEVAGGAAEVVSTFRSEDWGRRIQDLLGDSSKLQAMRARGFERLSAYSWDTTARIAAEAYSEVAAG